MTGEILNVPMGEYVRDAFAPSPPSLSSGLANVLLTKSPLHCWTGHARLNPAWSEDSSRDFDLGTACHAVLLENKPLTVLPFKDYRKDSAKDARDKVIAEGGLPVLPQQAACVAKMVDSARAKLARCPDLRDLGDLLAERTIRWKDGGAWCRCRPDWMAVDHAVVVSLKTTTNAEPEAFGRHLQNMGYHTQAAFELAGLKAVTGVDAHYFWLAVETEPPYEASLVGLSPMMLDFGQQTYRRAVDVWAQCIETDEWPGYPDRIAYVDPAPWAVAQFAERHMYAAGGTVADL